MTNLIDRRTRLRILKKNNKLKYKFYVLNIKSSKYISLIGLLLALYLIFRYFRVKCLEKENEENDNDNMMNVNYKKGYKSYSIKNSSKLSENNYLEKYRTMPTRVRPVPNKVINNYI